MPALETVRRDHQAQRLVILAVNIRDDEGPNAAKQYFHDLGLGFTVVRDETGSVQATYKVIGTPTNFFVDRRGVVVGKHAGAMDRMALEKKLTAIL